MKKRIISALLLIAVICSLSSCILIDGVNLGLGTTQTQPAGDTYVTVEKVEEIDGITINSNYSPNILAATKALLSAVSIACKFEKLTSSGYKEGYSSGSGVIFSLDKAKGEAYVLTNYHVVYDENANTKNRISDEISLFLYGQEYADYAIPATYVGGSMQYDLAVLKVSGSQVLIESNAVAAEFADSDKVSVLDIAIAVGNPEGESLSATVGYVNVDSEEIDNPALSGQSATQDSLGTLRVMRIDAAVNHGNSGGGLFNDKGQLIGIVNAKIVDDSVDNIGYAIPSNVAKYIAENILYYCNGKDNEYVKRCMLGISIQVSEASTDFDKETGRLTKVEKVKIVSLTDKSAAKGILKENDIINSLTLDGKKYEITRLYHVTDVMLNARPGSTVIFNVTRDGVTTDVTMVATEAMLTVYK